MQKNFNKHLEIGTLYTSPWQSDEIYLLLRKDHRDSRIRLTWFLLKERKVSVVLVEPLAQHDLRVGDLLEEYSAGILLVESIDITLDCYSVGWIVFRPSETKRLNITYRKDIKISWEVVARL